MNRKNQFTRPESLDNGHNYLFREHNFDGKLVSISTVTFVSYTPCPAIVIIKFGDGSKHRCLRDDLFEPRDTSLNQIASAEVISKFLRQANIIKTHLVMIFNTIRTAFSYQANII